MKRCVIGVDGGGTKTRMVLGRVDGTPLADVTESGSNHQHVGRTASGKALTEGFQALLAQAGVSPDELAGVFLALSGADIPADFALYDEICREAFRTLGCPEVPFTVANDVWAVMRAGLREDFGAVLICGTGANAAAKRRDGESFILRQLEYELGAYGGSSDISREAFHAAFRSNEKTGPRTRLEAEIPGRLGFDRIEECIPLFYPQRRISVNQFGEVTKLTFDLARQGDPVCIELLLSHGARLAWNLRGVLAQAGLENEAVPAVLGGTLLSFEDTPLWEGLVKELAVLCPGVFFVRGQYPPVYGAYLRALETAGGTQNAASDAAWKRFWNLP